MGPTSPAPLPAGNCSGKALSEMARGQASLNAPPRRDRGEGLEDKASLSKLLVRNGETSRAKVAAAPEGQIEVEHSWTPSPAGPAAELLLDLLQAFEDVSRLKIAFDERNRIGEIAACATERRIEDDRRSIEQSKLLVEPRNRRLDDTCWASEVSVRPVRSDRDCVEVRCMRHGGSPRSARCA